MKKGFTLVEVLVAIAIVAIAVGLIAGAVRRFGQPQVVATQPIGTAEASGSRNVVKVHYSQIESYLAGLPGNVKIVSVVPLYTGSGKTFDISNYLVVIERVEPEATQARRNIPG
jgi:prepilin-type N-terminal cleavage/methylation domain-containing protein